MLKIFNLILCLAVSVHAIDTDAIQFPEDEHISSRVGVMFHQHQNNQNQHKNHEIKGEESFKSGSNTEIPLTLIQKLNEIDNLPDLLDTYLEGKDMLTDIGELANRFGERNPIAVMPKPAICIPTPQTVELKSSNDSSLFFFPSCTRIDRCGGCCSHSLLSCQPVSSETVAFQVVVSQYTGGNKLTVRRKELISVEKHTKCRCDCRIKKEDCNVFQEYRKDECRCACTNLDEKKKCDVYNETKLWDPTICKCRCRNIDDCTTGSYFDQNRCACVPIPVRRRFAELGSSKERSFNDKEKYNIDTLGVAPLTDEKIEKHNF